jgi:hypothetical protein
MKTKIKIDGKTHEIGAFMARAIKADALDKPAQVKAKADALEVGEITIEGQDLVLPKATIDQILAMLGGSAGSSAPEPDPMPTDAAPIDPMVPAQMGDAEDPEKDKSAPKGDGLTQGRVDAMVAAALAKVLPAATRKIADAVTTTSRERSALERDASLVLGQRHDFAGQDDHAIAVAVLKADKSPRLPRAEALAVTARKGDAAGLMAAGALREMMNQVLDARRDAQDSTTDLAAAVFEAGVHGSRSDASDDETPERVRVARDKRDQASKRPGAAA